MPSHAIAISPCAETLCTSIVSHYYEFLCYSWALPLVVLPLSLKPNFKLQSRGLLTLGGHPMVRLPPLNRPLCLSSGLPLYCELSVTFESLQGSLIATIYEITIASLHFLPPQYELVGGVFVFYLHCDGATSLRSNFQYQLSSLRKGRLTHANG